MEAEEAESGEADDEAYGQADALIGEREIDGVMGKGSVEKKADDGKKGSKKKGGHARSHAHEKGLEPAEIAQGDAEERAFGMCSFDMMWRGHLQ